jgi:hypothetical protein
VILVQDTKDKDCTLSTRKSSAYHSLFNFASLLCFPSSTFPSPNFHSLHHIARHTPLLPVYPGSQAMADAKGKGKEIEREEAVAEGELNPLPFQSIMAELLQGASCFLMASWRRFCFKFLSCFEISVQHC